MIPPATLQSHRRPLGATGIEVSALGLGTVKLGRNRGLKYPAPFELPSDEQAARLMGVAREVGINLIDTAPAYGVAEERLGELLAGQRDRWVIVTKAGEEFDGATSRFDFSPGAITASVERSLERLRTDMVDIVLLHSDGRDVQIIEQSGGLEALARLKERGAIRAFGISTKTVEGAMRAIAWGRRGVDVVMVALNPQHQDEMPAVEAAREKGVGVLIKKALVSGHVGGATGRDEAALTPARCIAFGLGVPGVSSLVVGTVNPEHLRANAAAALRALDADRRSP